MKTDTKSFLTLNLLENINSKYIVKKILSLPKTIRSLTIIKYNKSIQERCDINLNTYIRVYKKISQIEITIIPSKRPFEYNNSKKFINIQNPEVTSYCHIYFNDKNEEIKRNYYTENYNVSSIKILLDYNITSFHKLFERCICIQKMTIKKHRNDITDMSYMFFDCSSLEEINFINFNTDNVTDMSFMFYGCLSLEKLDLSCFNTENVTNMRNMFNNCRFLEELDLSSFDTYKVTNMGNMFNNCKSLKKLNISNFNTRNVFDMKKMFASCLHLTHLDLSNFNTQNVENMHSMFYDCYNLTDLDISNFNTCNVIFMSKMFYNCHSLQKISKFYFDTSKVLEMKDVFFWYEDEIQTKIKSRLSHLKNI